MASYNQFCVGAVESRLARRQVALIWNIRDGT